MVEIFRPGGGYDARNIRKDSATSAADGDTGRTGTCFDTEPVRVCSGSEFERDVLDEQVSMRQENPASRSISGRWRDPLALRLVCRRDDCCGACAGNHLTRAHPLWVGPGGESGVDARARDEHRKRSSEERSRLGRHVGCDTIFENQTVCFCV